MKNCFYVDLFKAGVSCLTSVFSLAMTVCMLYIQRPVSAFVFGAVAVLFFFLAMGRYCGSRCCGYAGV